MSFDKAIASGKEHRKQYRGSKAFDAYCRNHGGCSWCAENRQYANIKAKQKADAAVDEYLEQQDTKDKKQDNKNNTQQKGDEADAYDNNIRRTQHAGAGFPAAQAP